MSNRLKIRPWPGIDFPDDPSAGKQSAGRQWLAAFGRHLRGRRVLFLATVGGLWLAAAAVMLMLPERYTGVAMVLIETTRAPGGDRAMPGTGAADPVEGEVEVLSSRGLAERVVRRLGPSDDATPTVDGFLERLRIERRGRSQVIKIAYRAESPQRAAKIANAVADTYVVERLEASLETTRRAAEWTARRLSELRSSSELSEQAANRAGLALTNKTGEWKRRIGDLQAKISQSRARRARIQTRLAKTETLIGSMGQYKAAASVPSDTLKRLRELDSSLRRRALRLAAETDVNDPRLTEYRVELRKVRTRIEAEVGRIIDGLRNEANDLAARENALTSALKEAETGTPAPTAGSAKLASLQHKATASRALYEAFLARFGKGGGANAARSPVAHIISRAVAPQTPSFPDVPAFLAIAFAAAIVAGLIVIAVAAWRDRGFRSLQQIEQEIGLPTLGLVPMVPGNRFNRPEPPDYILERPVSAYSEAIRALYTAILMSNTERPPKLLMIASAAPNEGKTSLALSFARMVGRIGQKKVVLVDCDTRHPQVHNRLGKDASPGLVEYLAGEATLEQILQVDEHTNALVIAAGRKPSNSVELLTSDRFHDLLSKLSEACDLVIIDSSPVLAISDAKILARLVDKTIFVARWARTRRDLVIRGVKELMETGGDIAGIALIQVDVRKHARFGFSDSGVYHGAYRKYYSG